MLNIFFLSFSLFFSFGCGPSQSETRDPILSSTGKSTLSLDSIFYPTELNPENGIHYFYNDLQQSDVLDFSYSKNGRVAVLKLEPSTDEVAVQISENKNDGFLETYKSKHFKFLPTINDRGEYAFVEKIDSKYLVHLNSKIIGELPPKDRLITAAMSDKYLSFGMENPQNGASFYLQYYSFLTASWRTLSLPGVPQRTFFSEEDILIVQCYLIEERKNSAFIIDLTTGSLREVDRNEGDQIITNVNKDGFSIIIYDGKTKLGKLKNALFHWKWSIRDASLSNLNNFSGTFAWHTSYQLFFLNRVLKKTGDYRFKSIIDRTVKNIFKNSNGNYAINDEHNPTYLWSAPSYSLDGKSPIVTFPPKIGAFESSELMGYRGPSGRTFYETITLFSGANYADFERG